nr:MAG TPA: hypothetical protein [Caudoviricetes sp.]
MLSYISDFQHLTTVFLVVSVHDGTAACSPAFPFVCPL